MRRGEFEHAIRAVGSILGTNDVLVIGSLWIAKAIANRPKDIEFCEALLNRAIVEPATSAPA